MKTFNRIVFSSSILFSSLFLMAGIARSQTAPFAISFYTPTNGQQFAATANVSLYLKVTDSNVVRTVQYFSGGSLLRTLTNTSGVLLTNSSPTSVFSMVWSNVTAGTYTLTAVGTDSAGLTATSAPVSITVTNPVLHPAVYIYSPTNNAMFLTPANLTLYARAVETGGTVATVQFFGNSASLGVVSNSSQAVFTNISSEPLYPLAWSNVLTGSYAIKAVATDVNGNSSTSSVVSISVVTNFPPVIVRPSVGIYSPTNGTRYVVPANMNIYARAYEGSTGTVTTVQFFANSLNLGVVSNSSQAVFTNISSEPLYPLAWSNAPAGSYSLKAVATDASGMTSTSSVVSISVVSNTPPPIIPFAISFSYPTNGQAYLAPANVGIRVLVTDSNVVRTVQFFSGTTSLGIITNTSTVLLTNSTQSNPFYLTWSNVPSGSYTLTALATDIAGNTATTSPVNITVTNVPPPNVPFAIGFWYPTNGQSFLAPATIGIHALVVDSNVVRTVQYFSGATSLGIVTNTGGVLLTNTTQGNPFFLSWSNVPAGSYALTAMATDSAGNTATSSVVNITVTNSPLPNIPFVVSFWYPTNGQTFIAPANIGVHALVVDSNVVQTVQYFANGNSLGSVTNSGGVLLTNSTQGNPFYLSWSNVPAGNYALTALATDSAGHTATSAPVNIIVTNLTTPNIKPSVGIYSPANGASYLAPATVKIYARAYESTGQVATVEFFENNLSLGVVPNSSQMIVSNLSSALLYPMTWSNVPAGSYALKVIATDTNGNTATSSVVNITIVTNLPPPNVPFTVGFWYPTNGQMFAAPANIGVHARVTDSNVVQTVQYFANSVSIGTVTNSGGVWLTNTTQGNPFFLAWSNVPTGTYALTAVATDSAGHTASSAPVTVFVLTTLPPVISIYATDPVAIEGSGFTNWSNPTSTVSAYVSGTNTATFVVHRDSSTNTDLTVYYSIGGTAINGTDYEPLPGYVTIPAGQSYALITIYPLEDPDYSYPYYDTVVLSPLAPPTAFNSPATYSIGSPASAAAIILEEYFLPLPQPVIRSLTDSVLHISLPATNGMNFSLQVSTDMVNWLPVCTNTVLKGSAQFVDPNGTSGTGVFYRIVPVATPASY